jgi:RNA polymerase sigma-70 factor (sigma-E family)
MTTRPADWELDFTAYVDGRGAALRGTAYLLCGDWHAAEDLTQAALTKLYLAWRRIDRSGSVDAYARQVLLRTFLDERRRPWRRERSTAEPPDRPARSDPAGAVDERLALQAALRRLPPSQRAVVVLRHWCDLDVRETAATLGISEGTVKSASARGLAALREVLQGSRPQPGPIGEVTR